MLAVVFAASVTVALITPQGLGQLQKLESARYEVVFAPQAGRLMKLARKGQPNVLWNHRQLETLEEKPDEWFNVGGDKLWIAPQSDWVWPPPKWFDPGKWQIAELSARSLSIWTDTGTGLLLSRKFTIVSDDAAALRINIVNRARWKGEGSRTLALWQVTQVDDPSKAFAADIEPPIPYPDVPTELMARVSSPTTGGTVFRRLDDKAYKVGFGPRLRELRATTRGGEIALEAAVPLDATYVDDGKAWQLFSGDAPIDYMELEVTSPLVTLQPEQSVELRTTLVLR